MIGSNWTNKALVISNRNPGVTGRGADVGGGLSHQYWPNTSALCWSILCCWSPIIESKCNRLSLQRFWGDPKTYTLIIPICAVRPGQIPVLVNYFQPTHSSCCILDWTWQPHGKESYWKVSDVDRQFSQSLRDKPAWAGLAAAEDTWQTEGHF